MQEEPWSAPGQQVDLRDTERRTRWLQAHRRAARARGEGPTGAREAQARSRYPRAAVVERCAGTAS